MTRLRNLYATVRKSLFPCKHANLVGVAFLDNTSLRLAVCTDCDEAILHEA